MSQPARQRLVPGTVARLRRLPGKGARHNLLMRLPPDVGCQPLSRQETTMSYATKQTALSNMRRGFPPAGGRSAAIRSRQERLRR